MTVSARPPPRAPRKTKAPHCTKQAPRVVRPQVVQEVRPHDPYHAIGWGGGSVAVPRVVRPRPRTICSDAVSRGSSVREWLGAECESFRGMRTVRPQTWGDIQGAVDGLHDAGALGEDCSLSVDVLVGAARPGEDAPPLDAAIRASAARLVGPLVRFGLPAGLTEQVQRDAEEIGVAVAELIPATDRLTLKLELMREDGCQRWHQDYYVARAIVSYNCCGTEYVHHGHVDFWELNNCGNNDHVVRDRTAVCQAGVGDILFIKGALFPGSVNGLVHRAPDHVYHPDGVAKTRLVLKVDVKNV